MLDKWLADFCVQAFRFVYFNGYLLFRGIFSKLLPLKKVMRETQLQDIETISLLIAEGWVQALYILLGTLRDSVPVTSFSVAGEAPLRSIAHSLAQLHRRCQSQFEVTRQHSQSSVLLCHSPSLHVQPSLCHVTARLFSQDLGLTAPSPDHQCQRHSCNADGPVCLCMLLGTRWWLPHATHCYRITADMGAVGNGGITISSLCNEVQILLWDLLCITE